MKQEQFLDVVSREEAERRFRQATTFTKLGSQAVPLADAWGRVLAEPVAASGDVPGFTRANMDGFAVRAGDTFAATEEEPSRLSLNAETLATGVTPTIEVGAGTATPIATGAVLPRGADAVVMVEDTDVENGALHVRRPVAPGGNISMAGSDIARGETVLHEGVVLTSRDTGILAALGLAAVAVVRRPRVAIFSTGNEIVAPGAELPRGFIHDANGRILADAVREAGGEAVELGILEDNEQTMRAALDAALKDADLVLMSGGTSKGTGDLSYRVVAGRGEVLFHGVALKPGKPIALAVVDKKPVVILPGFPTSAVFTFHTFVAPWVRARAGRPPSRERTVKAVLPRAFVSARGRAEYDLVHLVEGRGKELVAYPLGKGSGSVTTFSRADGFHLVEAGVERREAGAVVDVTLIGAPEPPDLVVIGSHCTGLDVVLAALRERGYTSRVIAVGSTAGLEAARRGECDVAGIHLLDEKTDTYNAPFCGDGVELVSGYVRRQGVVGDESGPRMVNRNRGSGTRVLVDRLLDDLHDGRRPDGYDMEVRSHEAVAAAVRSGRADWGVCIEQVAAGLPFRFLAEEHFDFAVPADRRGRPAVAAFVDLLSDAAVRGSLSKRGFLA